MMDRVKNLSYKLSIMFITLCSNVSFAMYDTTTGRFLQQDPLGMDPVSTKVNTFNPPKQYSEGVNIYQYVKNNSLR